MAVLKTAKIDQCCRNVSNISIGIILGDLNELGLKDYGINYVCVFMYKPGALTIWRWYTCAAQRKIFLP